MARYRLTNLTQVGLDEEIILEKVPGFFARLFGAENEIMKFRGEVTVWHQVPSGRRPGTMMEVLISELVARYKIRSMPAE